MAYLSTKEQYLKFKGFPELMTPLQSGDSDCIVKIKSGTVVEVDSETVALLAEIEPQYCKGFKNETNVTKIAWNFTGKSEKRFMKDTVNVSRLEKTLHQDLRQKIGTWFCGEIFISCTSLLFQQFEAGADSKLSSLVALDLKDASPTFDVPAASGGGNKGGGSYAPKENEILKQRMDFVLSVVAQSGDFGQGVVPSAIELSFWATSGINTAPGTPADRALSVNSLVFLLWFGMNLSGATVPVEDIRKIVGGNFGQ